MSKRSKYVYHLGLDLRKTAGAQYALLPGDPFRSEAIARALAGATTNQIGTLPVFRSAVLISDCRVVVGAGAE